MKKMLNNAKLELLFLAAEGKSKNEISRILKMDLNSVKTNLDELYKEVGITNKVQAAIYCINNGLIK